MARVSDAEKRKSHDRILDAAASLFRERGVGETSVAQVMEAAGMTHGGFYRHFADKDELTAAAFSRAAEKVVADLEGADVERAEAALAEYVSTYLSLDHVGNPGKGCPIAALGTEIGRSSAAIRRQGEGVVRQVASLLAGKADQGGYARLALLVGAVTLARMTKDEGQAAVILQEARAAFDAMA